jgi:hypothetical protein
MTTYKEIFGKYVKNYSSDPTSDAEGQVWYNSTTGVFKTNLNAGAAWASGGNLTTARNGLGGAGTQTVRFRLLVDIQQQITNATEEYDGSQRGQLVGNMGTARKWFRRNAGTQTAGLADLVVYGPTGVAVTQKNTMVQLGQVEEIWQLQEDGLGGAGTQTSGLAFGGVVTTAAVTTHRRI